MTALSIIIVSFNAAAALARCLESLHAAPAATPYDIVVVDNASTDRSVETARRWPGVRVVEVGSNAGFARANNIGIRQSQGTNILLLNSDTIVPPNAIDRLVSELDRDPDVAVVGPRLVDDGGRAELSFGRMIGPPHELPQKRIARRRAVDALTRRRPQPARGSGAV